jgi:hypothetical protein
MQPQKCSLDLYTNFLISNHNRYSGAELERVTPVIDMHHDAVSRWLASSKYTPSDLWNQVKTIVHKESGYLVCDDSLLDKRFSRKNELAKVQYSGNEHGLVNGISLVNLLWTDLEEIIPVDYRIYDKARDDKTKNDHVQDMLDRAKKRLFSPLYVLMDAWYGSIENLKHIRKQDWHFMTNLKSNRQVSLEKNIYVSVSDLDFADEQAKKVWLKEYGYVLVRRIVATNGDTMHVATSDLELTDKETFLKHWQHRWNIEEFHRGIKQTTGIEKCYSIKASSQKTHIFASFVAFIRLETRRLKDKMSWYEQKAMISRSATRLYLANA